MSAFADLLDDLLTLKARERAAGDAVKTVKAKAETMAIERHADEGARTWDRPDGGISIVQPKPRFDIVDPDLFVAWLTDNGHGAVVIERLVVTDAETLADTVRFILDRKPDTNTDDPSGDVALTGADAVDLERILIDSTKLVSEPAANWHEHVNVSTPGERAAPGSYPVATPDGETVPGVEYVVSPPSGIQVRPAKSIVERFAAKIGGGR